MLSRLALVLALLTAGRVARADPDDVRHVDDQVYFASLDPSALSKQPSANPLVPLPGAEQRENARLTATPPKAEKGPRRWGVFGAGAALFAIGYGLDAGLTYGEHHAPSWNSLVPVVGPLFQFTQRYSVVSTPTSTGDAQVDAMAKSASDGVNKAVQGVVMAGLAVDFAVQLAGVVMMIAGPTTHTGRGHKTVSVAAGGLRMTF